MRRRVPKPPRTAWATWLRAGLGHWPRAKLAARFQRSGVGHGTGLAHLQRPHDASQSLARFCAGLDYEALPPVAIERVKHFLAQ